jgi:hypothetical protein
VADAFMQALAANGAAILIPEERQRFTAIFDPKQGHVQHAFLSKSVAFIAEATSVERGMPSG